MIGRMASGESDSELTPAVTRLDTPPLPTTADNWLITNGEQTGRHRVSYLDFDAVSVSDINLSVWEIFAGSGECLAVILIYIYMLRLSSITKTCFAAAHDRIVLF